MSSKKTTRCHCPRSSECVCTDGPYVPSKKQKQHHNAERKEEAEKQEISGMETETETRATGVPGATIAELQEALEKQKAETKKWKKAYLRETDAAEKKSAEEKEKRERSLQCSICWDTDNPLKLVIWNECTHQTCFDCFHAMRQKQLVVVPDVFAVLPAKVELEFLELKCPICNRLYDSSVFHGKSKFDPPQQGFLESVGTTGHSARVSCECQPDGYYKGQHAMVHAMFCRDLHMLCPYEDCQMPVRCGRSVRSFSVLFRIHLDKECKHVVYCPVSDCKERQQPMHKMVDHVKEHRTAKDVEAMVPLLQAEIQRLSTSAEWRTRPIPEVMAEAARTIYATPNDPTASQTTLSQGLLEARLHDYEEWYFKRNVLDEDNGDQVLIRTNNDELLQQLQDFR